MKQTLFLAALLLATPALAQKPAPGIALFNGKDLTGWQVPTPNPFWRVENAVLIGENDAPKKGHVLRTEKSYKDFVLELDVRWNGEIDGRALIMILLANSRSSQEAVKSGKSNLGVWPCPSNHRSFPPSQR